MDDVTPESVSEPMPPVKKSPTGRIPQWAADEALGVDHEATPFRGTTGKSMLEYAGEGGTAQYAGGLYKSMLTVGAVVLVIAIAGLVFF